MILISIFSIVISLGVIALNVQPVWIQLLAFAISAALFLTTLFKEASKSGTSKTFLAKIQSRSFLIISFFVLITINIICKKYDTVFDLSKSKVYALRPETISWIQKIKDPTDILIFLRRDDKTVTYAEWLQKQINQSTDKVHIEIKNINQEISLTQKYDVHQTGEVVLTSGSQWVKIPNFQEKNLIQGIARLISKTSSSLCFLTGHGEADLEDESGEGLSELKSFIEGMGYRALSVSFASENTFESQCGLLAIINPKTNFLPEELTSLQNIYSSPLPLLLTLDTTLSSNIRDQLKKWGLTASKDLVVDMQNISKKRPLTDLVINILGSHPVFENLTSGLYLPQTQALFMSEKIDEKGSVWTPLLITPKTISSIQLLENKTEPGPYTLAAISSVQNSPKVVISSGRAFLSSALHYAENQSFFFNITKTLLKEPIVDISKSFEESEKRLDISPIEITWVKNTAFYILPLILAIVCLIIWMKRL